MTADEDDFLALDKVDMEALHGDIRDMIRWVSSNAKRSLQRSLGPSEVGHPCDRKLAFGMMYEAGAIAKGTNTFSDPLPSIIGTATHSWLQDACEMHNEKLGRTRWIPEQRVQIRPGLEGTCDLYDVDTATVVDWKVLGPTNHGKYSKHGPPIWYRRQVQLYGKGYARLGFPVKNVAICFLPRSGQLSRSHLWSEPYDPAVADEVTKRMDDIALVAADLDVEHHPDRYAMIPITPGDHCDFCPHWSPRPRNGTECPGPAAPKL